MKKRKNQRAASFHSESENVNVNVSEQRPGLKPVCTQQLGPNGASAVLYNAGNTQVSLTDTDTRRAVKAVLY